MKKIAILIMFLSMLLITLASCEKYSPEDSDNTNSSGITKDGVIQRTGLVDLGLSVKWGACDLGNEDFVEDCTISGAGFNWSTKEINTPPAEIGGTSFDNATEILGDKWQTPSKAQWNELIKKCRISYGVFEDTVGLIVTGPSGKAIFFPVETNGYLPGYWCSSSKEAGYDDYYYYDLTSNGIEEYCSDYYDRKYHIRPVEKK